jgi:hypothetical protein
MTTTVKKPIDVPPRHPRPRAITTAEAVLNDRFVEKRWAIELIEKMRDSFASVDHHIQGRDLAGARAIIVEADVELDMTVRCLQGDIPGATALVDPIAKRDGA